MDLGADSITTDSMEELRRIFDLCDEYNQGVIHVSNFIQVFKSHLASSNGSDCTSLNKECVNEKSKSSKGNESALSSEDEEQLVKFFDPDSDGLMSFSDFVKGVEVLRAKEAADQSGDTTYESFSSNGSNSSFCELDTLKDQVSELQKEQNRLKKENMDLKFKINKVEDDTDELKMKRTSPPRVSRRSSTSSGSMSMSAVELRNTEYLDYVVSLQKQLMNVKDVAHEYQARVEGLINEKTKYQEEVEHKNNYIARLEHLLEETNHRNLLTTNFVAEVTAKIEEPIKLLTSTVKEEMSMSTMNLKTVQSQSSYEDEMREEVRRLKREMNELKEENEELYAQLREIHETTPSTIYGFNSNGWSSLPNSRSASRSSCSCGSDGSGHSNVQSSPLATASNAGHQVASSTPITPSARSSSFGPCSGNWPSSFLPRRRRSAPTNMVASTPNLRADINDESIRIPDESKYRSIGVSCILEESLKDEDLDRIWTLLPSGEDLDSNSYERESKSLTIKNPWADDFKYRMSRRKSGVPSNTFMVKLVQLIDRFVIAKERKVVKTDKIV